MAKSKVLDADKLRKELYKRTEGYAYSVRKLYVEALEKVIDIVKGTQVTTDKPFNFADYGYQDKVTPIFRNLYSQVYHLVKQGIISEWTISNQKADELVKSVFGKKSIEDNHYAKYFARNKEAVDAFFTRKTQDGGLNLSQRVWKYTGMYKSELEDTLDLALGEGTPAMRLSATIQKYLQDPDKFYRRFRVKTGEDEDGNPIYGRIWKRRTFNQETGTYQWVNDDPRKYHPGQGVYRSSARNAQRLARTETNMAYRTAEFDRWQAMDFVVGVEIKLSNNHPISDICDLLQGKYPKDFKWTGWHPNCRCYQVPILVSEQEVDKMTENILNGQDPGTVASSEEITELPKEFRGWIEANAARIDVATEKGTLPYFIRDNVPLIEGYSATSGAAGAKSPVLETISERIAAKYQSPMTFEDADGMNCNPNYGKAAMYKTNCQSSVVAYELRRRGLDVEAYGNPKAEWYMPFELGKRPEAAWLTKDGEIPTPYLVKGTVNAQTLGDSMSLEGRYQLWFNWNGQNKGHVITAERLANGKIRYYDAQNGLSSSEFLFSFDRIDASQGVRILRMDNLEPNEKVIDGIVKAAKSKAKAPRMTMDQISWWLENAQGTTKVYEGYYKDIHALRNEAQKSGKFILSEEREMANLQTGRIWNKGEARNLLIKHLRSDEYVTAAIYIWNHPEELRFVRNSPLGEGKDLNLPKDIANIEKKKARHVTSYNQYQIDINGETWMVKMEVISDKREQFYHIMKKK